MNSRSTKYIIWVIMGLTIAVPLLNKFSPANDIKHVFKKQSSQLLTTVQLIDQVKSENGRLNTNDHNASLLLRKSVLDQKPVRGGTLFWGTINSPTIINPVLTSHSVSSALLSLIFDSLVKVDSRGQIVPSVAWQWEKSEDGLQYTFKLKKGLRFHDGHELTAEDVKFTYDLIADPQNKSHWRTNTELVDRWEVVNRYKLRVYLKEPFSSFLYKLTREIVPKHLLQGKALQAAPFNYHPVGSGPFKFRHWDRLKNEISLEANPFYIEGRPYLDRIVVRSYPDNHHLWGALMRREINLVKFINREDYLVLKEDKDFKTYSIPDDMYFALVYNLNDSLFQDLSVRQALAMTIDKKKILDLLNMGGLDCTGPFSVDTQGYDQELEPVEFNPSKAQELLTKAGWKDLNQDGLLEKDGNIFEFRVLIPRSREVFRKIILEIHQQLSELGIKVVPVYYEHEKELNAAFLKEHQPHAWLRLLAGRSYGIESDAYDSSRDWYSFSSEFGKLWPYKNLEVDRLFQKARGTVDLKQRTEIYRKIHRIIYNDQPACFLFFLITYHAVSSDILNTDGLFNRHMPDYVIKDWFKSNQRRGGD